MRQRFGSVLCEVVAIIVSESAQGLLWQMEKGNDDALETVYRRYHGEIYQFALHMTGSKWIAEDVTRQVF